MKTSKSQRFERCDDLLHAVKYRSERSITINVKDIAREFILKGNILNDAEKCGVLIKNGNGYRFLKPITPENVWAILNYSSEIDKKGRERRKAKREIELQNIQKEIWTSTPVPDVSFDDLKPQRINPITIDELISDMENLWVKFNEYAKIQKP